MPGDTHTAPAKRTPFFSPFGPSFEAPFFLVPSPARLPAGGRAIDIRDKKRPVAETHPPLPLPLSIRNYFPIYAHVVGNDGVTAAVDSDH